MSNKRWAKEGGKYILYFTAFYEEEAIAKLIPDSDDGWCYTSKLLRADGEYLDSETLAEAQQDIEDMISDHFQDQVNYNLELLRAFEEGDEKLPADCGTSSMSVQDTSSPRPDNNPLTRKNLYGLNDERVWVQYDNFGMYALVAYHADPDGDDGDDVFLTNCLGGRDSFEEIIGQGGTVYREKP